MRESFPLPRSNATPRGFVVTRTTTAVGPDGRAVVVPLAGYVWGPGRRTSHRAHRLIFMGHVRNVIRKMEGRFVWP